MPTVLLRAQAPLLALIFLFAFAITTIMAPVDARADTFRCPLFTIDLPKGWSLVNGPFKKKGGETAVLGRRDRKASIQMLYGPSIQDNLKTIVEGYARGLNGKPVYDGNQAWFDATRNGQRMRFVFCQDEPNNMLAIFILNGNPAEMSFVSTGMKTKYPGLVPKNVFETPPSKQQKGRGK